MLNKYGYDIAINYKTENIDEALKKIAPEGLDYYFDQVSQKLYINDLKKYVECYAHWTLKLSPTLQDAVETILSVLGNSKSDTNKGQ